MLGQENIATVKKKENITTVKKKKRKENIATVKLQKVEEEKGRSCPEMTYFGKLQEPCKSM